MGAMETREIKVQDFEIRVDGDKRTFVGYAAVFNSDSEPLPFVERIAPGAFARSLTARNNVKMYVNHDDTLLLASTRSGTLRLAEDGKGLRTEATLPDTSYGRDLVALMSGPNPIVDSMSFGFSVPQGGDEWSGDGQRRTLTSVRLHEVSVVTGTPAYASTSAMVRKLDRLATRTATDANALSDAMEALSTGDLSEDQAALLRSVVDKVAPVAVVEAAPVREDIFSVAHLRQKLELLAKI